jgi:hypothetical protein
MITIIVTAMSLFYSPMQASQPEAESQERINVPDGATSMESGAWVLWVGGEADLDLETVESQEGPLYTSGLVRTDTKLPVGYPSPTPPGAIELKHYPSIRRAEYTSDSSLGGMGQGGFWPLFQHITRNDIAMTAPVEMEYSDNDDDAKAEQWTMAFLYHTTKDGPTGDDGSVTVVDTDPKTFLAIGVQGRQGWNDIESIEEDLDAWLAENPEWKRTGLARTLGYNGPNIPSRYQWWEVQIPVVPVTNQARPSEGYSK